jgi:hypothetical protein
VEISVGADPSTRQERLGGCPASLDLRTLAGVSRSSGLTTATATVTAMAAPRPHLRPLPTTGRWAMVAAGTAHPPSRPTYERTPGALALAGQREIK